MKKVSRNENKKIVIGLLDYFDAICRKNNIEYSLAGGTLLGAVRHGGFIPWDDDGDVIVTRDNYEKLKKVFYQAKNDEFGFMSEEDEGYYYVFSKLYDRRTVLETLTPQDAEIKDLGVYIDIFPIDLLPDPSKKSEIKTFYTRLMDINTSMFMTIPGFYYFNNNPLKRIIKRFIYYPRYLRRARGEKNPKVWQKYLLSELKKYDSSEECGAGFILSEYSVKECIPKKAFEQYMDIKFEDRKFRSIKDNKIYLESLYGDYMKLPPKDKRKPKHAYISYWK
ncbi:LicD family protein [Lactiplantibacillus plantarum]|uniref:LicD family protein n=1 Tax=Lactiplantibacillus plantarum TaxID=1590 RepID=UPI0038520A8A|nr:lipopolysaccharide biosynthesis protein LicD [Lactiplantibacillus plantarum]